MGRGLGRVWPMGMSIVMRIARLCALLMLAVALPSLALAQSPTEGANPSVAGPVAIIPLEGVGDAAPHVSGTIEIVRGRALLAAAGSVTSGTQTTTITLPHRGVLRVCASTKVNLTSDASVPAGETPGLMIAFDRGALEASFATGRNSDTILTPDFRILVGGPGTADLKVRLGDHGDTCVDNAGQDAPYVLVSGVFESGAYRVQPGQRVMFMHGSLTEVVDQEKESCGCPPPPKGGNEFPLAESEGLAPLKKAAPPVAVATPNSTDESLAPMVYNSQEHVAAAPTAPKGSDKPSETKNPPRKQGFWGNLRGFFRKLFGAE